MQLNHKNITQSLLGASCTLLGSNVHAQKWDIDAAILYYGEPDRVQAIEAIVSGTKEYSTDHSLSLKVVVDSLTGASANGAIEQATPQTFTRPSGNGQYTVDANTTPLDDTFRDTRVQLSAQWTQPLNRQWVYSGGANVSREYDYQSIALNSSFSRYFNTKNTTLTLGASLSFDSVDPVGGRPVALSEMVVDSGQFNNENDFDTAFNLTRDIDSENRNTVDVIFGLTQVMSKRWITQFNLSLSDVDGYLNDPYKLFSTVNNQGEAISQRFESRPDTRFKQAIFAQSKYHFSRSILDASIRIADDDWDISSQTLDIKYRFLLNNNHYIQPRFRYYQQDEAFFYQPFLSVNSTQPDYISADYRIGRLNAYTIGLKYGFKNKKGNDYAVRLEYYTQTPENPGVILPEPLTNEAVFPSVDALILQFNYSF